MRDSRIQDSAGRENRRFPTHSVGVAGRRSRGEGAAGERLAAPALLRSRSRRGVRGGDQRRRCDLHHQERIVLPSQRESERKKREKEVDVEWEEKNSPRAPRKLFTSFDSSFADLDPTPLSSFVSKNRTAAEAAMSAEQVRLLLFFFLLSCYLARARLKRSSRRRHRRPDGSCTAPARRAERTRRRKPSPSSRSPSPFAL